MILFGRTRVKTLWVAGVLYLGCLEAHEKCMSNPVVKMLNPEKVVYLEEKEISPDRENASSSSHHATVICLSYCDRVISLTINGSMDEISEQIYQC
jgi:hypothetical protein